MYLSNKMINRHIDNLRKAREGWLLSLERTPDSVVCAQHILSINTKIELLNSLKDYSQEDA